MRTLLLFIFIICPLFTVGQTPPDEYFMLVKKADSLFKAGDYKNSAHTYSSAFQTFGWKGYINDRYNAACSWAMSGIPDSALFNLERIALKAHFSEYQRMSVDPDLISLHRDVRWQSVLKTVRENQEKSEGSDRKLFYLLDSLEREDQKWRNYLTKYRNKETAGDTISEETIIRNSVLTDSLNYLKVREIFETYGFPNYDLAGEKGASNFWLLVQHQDNHPDFQESVLKKMKPEVDANKASASNYAYLVDRVKVNTKQLQVYGTQMQLNADGTSYEPKPVTDPDKLNERRESVGLNSIEEYIQAMNNRYFGTLKKK